MKGSVVTGGELAFIHSRVPWVDRLLYEATFGEIRPLEPMDPGVVISVEEDRGPFDVEGWEVLTRRAWHHHGQVVMQDVCSSGFDLAASCSGSTAQFRFRWRPPSRDRLAAWVLRSRFRLLARAVLLQYPAMWWSCRLGRAPLHASVYASDGRTPVLAGPGGVGKSTLVAAELSAGAKISCDNLCLSNGTRAWGVLEPLRWEGGPGRRTTHGRHEAPIPQRAPVLTPDRVIVVRRANGTQPQLRACDSGTAARSLMTGTYMASELRRYWGFAATLAAGTGIGPAHPPVADVAKHLAEHLPCWELVLGEGQPIQAGDLSNMVEAS